METLSSTETDRWPVSFVHSDFSSKDQPEGPSWRFQSLSLKSAVLQGQSGDISSERFCRPVMWLNQPRRHVTELRVRLSLVLHPRLSLMFHLLCLMHNLFAFTEKPHAYLPKARRFQIKGRSQLLCPYGIWALLITFILTCHVRINDSEMRLTLTPNCWKKKKQKTPNKQRKWQSVTVCSSKPAGSMTPVSWSEPSSSSPAKSTILKRRSAEIVYKPLTRGERAAGRAFPSPLYDEIRHFVCHWRRTTRNNVGQTQTPAAIDDKITAR